MRRLLAVGVLALLLAAPARAGAPAVDASAYLVVDARTGEVLAASHAHERLPIASITKLMTVLVTLEHHKLTDVVTVDSRAAAVGESTIDLRAGEQLTVRDLIKGALIQSANDAADALALSVAPDFPSFARLMNAKAAELGLRDTHFVRPDGLDAPGHYSSAADVTTLARVLMRTRFVRRTVAEQTDTIAGGRTLHTWDDLLSELPQTIGVKTGHTSAAGWCQVAAVRGRGVTVYATLLGSPTRAERNDDLRRLLVWGLSRFRVVPAVRTGRTYAVARVPYGRAPLRLVAAKPLLAVARVGRPLTERVTAAAVVSLPVRRGAVLGRVEIRAGGRVVGTRDLVASRTIHKPGVARRLGWYAGRAIHHLAHLL
ncbi:MAG TPA: D-alanyl-D-alanine carboxypeptidase family protein [Gaiellaceae bacterium]|jgi:D-alanyl-D-alanine carboxypeptidase (penicillin-binding protein 5/6)|nr:D-alanyl-D-alanine carboxypeptidase family protein [Gaiellaceae bacterium]